MTLEEAILHAMKKSRLRPCGQSMTHMQRSYDDAQEHKQIVGWIRELQSLQSAELRPVLKFTKEDNLQTAIIKQMNHIESEVREVKAEIREYIGTCCVESHWIERAALELADVQTSCETLMAILGLDENQRWDMRRKVIAKNRARNYYEVEK